MFMQTQIGYKGHDISDSQIRAAQNKIEAVAKFSIPSNVHQVRQYLGLIKYFRNYITDYASKARSPKTAT